jgi:acyl carrier protein
MRGYFEEKQPAHVMETFHDQHPKALLKESLDVVEFLVHVEEETGREIDINRFGEAMQNLKFGELAREISRLMAEEAAASEAA